MHVRQTGETVSDRPRLSDLCGGTGNKEMENPTKSGDTAPFLVPAPDRRGAAIKHSYSRERKLENSVMNVEVSPLSRRAPRRARAAPTFSSIRMS